MSAGAALSGTPRRVQFGKRKTDPEPPPRRKVSSLFEIRHIQDWLTRQKTIAPGLTNNEVALIERLINDMESA